MEKGPPKIGRVALTNYRVRGTHPRLLVGALVLLALVIGGGVGALITHKSSPPTPTRAQDGATTSPVVTTSPTAAPSPLTVSSMTPTANAAGVAANAPITVTFSSPLAKSSPLPSLSPSTPGSWRATGNLATFTPSTEFTPLSDITLTIPGGSSGVVTTRGVHLAATASEQFQIANGSVLRLQQLLSLLDYSPLVWTPTGAAPAPNDTAGQVAALYAPPTGSFSWRHRGWPARLRALWREGRSNVFTRGLVMSFQADHGLTANGHVGPGLWSALVSAVTQNTTNTGGYNYALANKASPQSLTIYHDGHVVLRSPANTGIAGSPTPDGTFPVNTRLRQQVMRGTNPNGQTYADLVQYIAYFHGNDAVHYMDRADYGIPQSLGCIELPLSDAARAWLYLAYGTLVTVIN